MLVATLLAAALPLGAGCQARSADARGGQAELTVFAAASLTEVLTTLGKRFERRRPGVDVTFSFQSSAALAQQIVHGAPADVYAAASPQSMAVATWAGMVAGEPQVFARNRLQIAAPAGNPGRVRGLADLARPELKIALCAAQAPCGAASRAALRAAGIRAEPDTYGNDVKAVLAKVTLGEVDAALVYRTDVRAAGDAVVGIDFPAAAKAANDYPVAVLREAPQRDAARAFAAYLGSAEARGVLAEAGFALP
ncbi:MAG: molybdate ABC transporter substrate-binding protein [Micromonosporaceae bacterium]|nr:molybdate ABC transporter substrate-binding protein [Micromonosporaceae bacterium]